MITNGTKSTIRLGQEILNGSLVKEVVGVDFPVKHPIVTCSKSYNLPPGKFIFGVFNHIFKLHPQNFDAYLEVCYALEFIKKIIKCNYNESVYMFMNRF